MARLYRPHIPLSVRVQVAYRQLGFTGCLAEPDHRTGRVSASWELKRALDALSFLLGCEVKDLRLDHHPALCNRQQFRNGRGEIVRYVPDANDPNHLIYRSHADHDIKTRVRGDGAQHSDLALRRIAKRRERKAERGKLSTNRLAKPAKRRNKKPWPNRPMPKGRGFPKRRG